MRKLVRRFRRLLSPTLRRPDLLGRDERETAIDFAYRFVLARPVDDEGRSYYLRRMRDAFRRRFGMTPMAYRQRFRRMPAIK